MKEIPEIDLARIDLNALWVIKRLRAKGYEAHLTGGCVRDLLLNHVPKDFDVATSAKPDECKRLFRNCRLIGRRFLLAHVFFPGRKIIETATFRANPDDVQDDLGEDLLVKQDNVYGNIQQDAIRRDFTINGLFYDPIEGTVLDFVEGKKDLELRLIRSIGDPDIRFREDPVRILRAIKFASRLGFSIEENTYAAMKKHAGEIVRCAPARLQEEMVRLLTSGNAATAISMCEDVGILNALMPELTETLADSDGVSSEEAHGYWIEILKSLDAISKKDTYIPASVAFAALLLPSYSALEKSEKNERNWIDKLCVSWAQRIRLARRDQDCIRILLSAVHLFAPEKTKLKSAHFLVKKPWFREALLLYISHLLAKNESLDQVSVWKELAHQEGAVYRQDKASERGAVSTFSPSGFRRRRPISKPRPA